MFIFVLPVSGGRFCNQLSSIKSICDIEIKPELIFSSSGGNVVAYLYLASKFHSMEIDRISKKLNHNFFIKEWNNLSLVNFVIGYFKSGVHDKGDGVTDFIKSQINLELLNSMEIWTGTYLINSKKSKLFCNLSKENSLL